MKLSAPQPTVKRSRTKARRATACAALTAAALLLGSAGSPAAASESLESSESYEQPMFVGWSGVLPAGVAKFQRSSEKECIAGLHTCVKRTLNQMERRSVPLEETCQHNAIFALSYLRTTEEYARVAAEPGFFRDPAFVNHEDAVFGDFYFKAYDAWTGAKPGRVPPAWKIAFDAGRDQKVTGSGNLFLGMNAHVNHDLPFVLAAIGLVAPDGTSRKADHDKVNEMLNRVVKPLLAELSTRFDPTMDDTATPYGVSYTAMLQVLVTWREQAWRNAERLVNAPDEAARAAVAAEIEAAAAANAQAIREQYSYKEPLTTKTARNAHCAAMAD